MFVCFWNSISLCSPSWPWTQDLPAPASCVPGLKASTTMLWGIAYKRTTRVAAGYFSCNMRSISSLPRVCSLLFTCPCGAEDRVQRPVRARQALYYLAASTDPEINCQGNYFTSYCLFHSAQPLCMWYKNERFYSVNQKDTLVSLLRPVGIFLGRCLRRSPWIEGEACWTDRGKVPV